MTRPNPIEEAVLDRWGITALTEETTDPDDALKAFLTRLKERVDKG